MSSEHASSSTSPSVKPSFDGVTNPNNTSSTQTKPEEIVAVEETHLGANTSSSNSCTSLLIKLLFVDGSLELLMGCVTVSMFRLLYGAFAIGLYVTNSTKTEERTRLLKIHTIVIGFLCVAAVALCASCISIAVTAYRDNHPLCNFVLEPLSGTDSGCKAFLKIVHHVGIVALSVELTGITLGSILYRRVTTELAWTVPHQKLGVPDHDHEQGTFQSLPTTTVV